MINDFQRPSDDYIWAMEQWLMCNTLSAQERQVIEWMKMTLSDQRAPWPVVQMMVVNNHFPTILSAIMKARAQGILKEWRR